MVRAGYCCSAAGRCQYRLARLTGGCSCSRCTVLIPCSFPSFFSLLIKCVLFRGSGLKVSLRSQEAIICSCLHAVTSFMQDYDADLAARKKERETRQILRTRKKLTRDERRERKKKKRTLGHWRLTVNHLLSAVGRIWPGLCLIVIASVQACKYCASDGQSEQGFDRLDRLDRVVYVDKVSTSSQSHASFNRKMTPGCRPTRAKMLSDCGSVSLCVPVALRCQNLFSFPRFLALNATKRYGSVRVRANLDSTSHNHGNLPMRSI